VSKRKRIPSRLKNKVVVWAGNECSYCQLSQEKVFGFTLHVEHIIPVAGGGTNAEENLCLSCAWCNLSKGAKTEEIDPHTGTLTSLYHPRKENWEDHFEWDVNDLTVLRGKTATGRATIIALDMNSNQFINARANLLKVGWHP
jgi:5-methylcytosine-specific restriction endonuclease McrA